MKGRISLRMKWENGVKAISLSSLNLFNKKRDAAAKRANGMGPQAAPQRGKLLNKPTIPFTHWMELWLCWWSCFIFFSSCSILPSSFIKRGKAGQRLIELKKISFSFSCWGLWALAPSNAEEWNSLIHSHSSTHFLFFVVLLSLKRRRSMNWVNYWIKEKRLKWNWIEWMKGEPEDKLITHYLVIWKSWFSMERAALHSLHSPINFTNQKTKVFQLISLISWMCEWNKWN